MSWSREQCEILIQEYQKHPCLYATKSVLYKNRHARQHALEKIEAVLKEVRPSVTINEIKTKFGGLKTNFLNEYKKWNVSRRSGACDNDDDDSLYKPTIWYFKVMFFLLEHCKVRLAVDSLTEDVETEQEDTERDSQSSEVQEYVVGEDGVLHDAGDENVQSPDMSFQVASPSSSNGFYQPKPKKRKLRQEPVEENLIREASNTLASINQAMKTNQGKNEEDEALAKFIVCKLNQITNEDIRLEVEQEIVECLYRSIKKSRM
ncbi:uncharacterized protein LOC116175315 [Photinus pyralis]|uniref:uncharacterized protein LOC116175315 n=1 Tax=Photinus pyralis TaxID=7054 RepID=UPI001267496D|nr:uncharacterized protein LOC116175315 [Photinus pyralis]